jgi:hypothetical protein
MSEQVGAALTQAIRDAGWDRVPPDAYARISVGDITMGELFAVAEALERPPEDFLSRR